MIGIKIGRGGFEKRLQGLLAKTKQPAALLMVCGRELSNLLRKHFRGLERSNVNKLAPGRREHFWLQVMRSVHTPEQTGFNQVGVRISDPRIAQKVFGGRIVAKKARALTIPVSEKAYGRTVSTFEKETGLKLFKIGAGEGDGSRGVLAAKVNGQIEVEYVLRKAVNQEAQADALPEMGKLEAAILARAEKVVARG